MRDELKSAASAKIGKKFAEKRKYLGYSLDQVSEILVINKDYLKAIEGGNYSIFPSESFAKAYFLKYRDFLKISNEFPNIFDVKASALVIESETSLSGMVAAGLDVRPAAQIAAVLKDRTLYLGTPGDAGTALMGQTAPSMALIRLPDRLPAPVSNCALLLVGKDTTSFQPELGSDLLVLLAEMVGVTLAARLEPMTAPA